MVDRWPGHDRKVQHRVVVRRDLRVRGGADAHRGQVPGQSQTLFVNCK